MAQWERAVEGKPAGFMVLLMLSDPGHLFATVPLDHEDRLLRGPSPFDQLPQTEAQPEPSPVLLLSTQSDDDPQLGRRSEGCVCCRRIWRTSTSHEHTGQLGPADLLPNNGVTRTSNCKKQVRSNGEVHTCRERAFRRAKSVVRMVKRGLLPHGVHS